VRRDGILHVNFEIPPPPLSPLFLFHIFSCRFSGGQKLLKITNRLVDHSRPLYMSLKNTERDSWTRTFKKKVLGMILCELEAEDGTE